MQVRDALATKVSKERIGTELQGIFTGMQHTLWFTQINRASAGSPETMHDQEPPSRFLDYMVDVLRQIMIVAVEEVTNRCCAMMALHSPDTSALLGRAGSRGSTEDHPAPGPVSCHILSTLPAGCGAGAQLWRPMLPGHGSGCGCASGLGYAGESPPSVPTPGSICGVAPRKVV